MNPERRTYRAESLEVALEAARAELGPGVRVVSANRMRRGGVLGFFATEIGVEVVCEAALEAVPGGAEQVIDHLIRGQRDQAEFSSRTSTPVVPKIERVPVGANATARDWAAVAAERVGVETLKENVTGDPLMRQAEVAEGLRRDAEAELARRRREADAERERMDAERARRDDENAREVAQRVEERQRELLDERLRERERAVQMAAERDAERRRAAQLEIEREKLSEQVVEVHTRAAEEIGRLQAEREEADRRAHMLRVEIERLQGEREGMRRREELLRDALHQEMVDSEVTTGMSSSAPYGVEVLEKLQLPEDVLRRVRGGMPLAKAIPQTSRPHALSAESGLVVLVGPGQLVLEMQQKLRAEHGVATSDCAYVTVRDLVSRENVGVRVLREQEDIVAWVDGRMDPHRTSILAVEYNATPSWASALRRVARSVPFGKWRLVLPASYPTDEVRTLLTALASHEPLIDVVGVEANRTPARILTFADRIATVDGEDHTGALWASLLWERACQL